MNPRDLTDAKIAEVMEISVPALEFMATHQDRSFLPTQCRKDEKGKTREIDPPLDLAKFRFGLLHRFWQREFPAHSMAHGGVRRRSHFSSAREHLGRKFVISRDLSNCYNSIKENQLRLALLRNGFTPRVAWLLSGLFTVHGRVPQGSPISGDALNEYLRYVDHVIASKAGRLDAGRSRLTDDIVISTDDLADAAEFATLVENQIAATGLSINEKKREAKGIQVASKIQDVHGLIVNSTRGTRVNKQYALNAVEAANEYRRQAKTLVPTTIESLAARRMIVTGHMFNCRQAEVSPARDIRRQLEAGDRQVVRKLLKAGLGRFRKSWWVKSSAMDPARLSRLWQARLADGIPVIASPATARKMFSTGSARSIISPFAAARLRAIGLEHCPPKRKSDLARPLIGTRPAVR